MIQKFLKLTKKTKLTHDVYELIFVSGENPETKAWQFITFLLPSWLRRAYSIADKAWNKFIFLIKRIEDWRWWSKEICDLEINSEIPFIWPVWHFILRPTFVSKLFLWTGTWFAPLYFQVLEALNNSVKSKITLVFWVRKSEDIFYEDILKKLKSEFPNFDYVLYLSREDRFEYRKWYVTEYLTKENIQTYNEFYMCWSPQMIWDSRRKLELFWISWDKIYFEQY